MSEEKYNSIKQRLTTKLERMSGNNGVSLSMMYNNKYLLISEILKRIMTEVNPIIESDADDYIKIQGQFYSINRLEPVDKYTESILIMITT